MILLLLSIIGRRNVAAAVLPSRLVASPPTHLPTRRSDSGGLCIVNYLADRQKVTAAALSVCLSVLVCVSFLFHTSAVYAQPVNWAFQRGTVVYALTPSLAIPVAVTNQHKNQLSVLGLSCTMQKSPTFFAVTPVLFKSKTRLFAFEFNGVTMHEYVLSRAFRCRTMMPAGHRAHPIAPSATGPKNRTADSPRLSLDYVRVYAIAALEVRLVRPLHRPRVPEAPLLPRNQRGRPAEGI